jgi:hypothetical protein
MCMEPRGPVAGEGIARGRELADMTAQRDRWAGRAGDLSHQMVNVQRAIAGEPLHAPAGQEAVRVMNLRAELGACEREVERLRGCLAEEQLAARGLSDQVAALTVDLTKAGQGV